MLALGAKHTDVKYPQEFIEMKFCEKFHLTPFEYGQLPSNLVSLWSQMSSIESSIQNQES